MANNVDFRFIAQDLYSRAVNKMKQVTIALGAAVAAAAAASIKFGSKFQQSMADVSAITGATGKDLKFFEAESLRLAKISITSQSEVADAIKLVASAKSELLKDPKGLTRVTEQILLLKNASGIELPEAVKVATESLNQFNAGADQASRFINTLAAGAKVGASEVGETGRAVVESAVFAKQAGLSFEQLNSAIQVLAKNGVKANKAGTGLKNVFVRLESTGIKKIMPSVVGLDKALENLSRMNLTTKQSSRLFGLEAAAAGDILIKNRKLVSQWTKEITGTNIAQEQADKRLATFSKKAQKLSIVVKDVLIRVFLKIEPILSRVANRISKFIETIDDRDIQSFVGVLTTIAKTALWVGSVFKSVLTPVITWFKSVGWLIGQVTGSLVDNLGPAFSTIGEIGGRTFEGITKFIGGALASFELMTGALSSIGSVFRSIGNFVTGLISKVASLLGKIKSALQSIGLLKKETEGLTIAEQEEQARQRARAAIAAADLRKAQAGLTKIDISNKSSTDINVNLRAPKGAVESVKAKSKGGGKNLKVGLNMEPATS